MSTGIFVPEGASPSLESNTGVLGDAGTGGVGGALPYDGRDGEDGIARAVVVLENGRLHPGESCSANEPCIYGECRSGTCELPGFVAVASGAFTMGSSGSESGRDTDEDQFEVTLTRDFYVSEFQMTNEEVERLVGWTRETSAAYDSHPARWVPFWEAIFMANDLSEAEGLATCYDTSACTGSRWRSSLSCSSIAVDLDCLGYRLPIEAEWEYFARAGTNTTWHCGNSSSCLSSVTSNAYEMVGLHSPNAWGLYDIHGGIREYVFDQYQAYPSSDTDDWFVAGAGPQRVARGGGYFDTYTRRRVANRFSQFSGTWSGLRVVQTIPERRPAGSDCTDDRWCTSGVCDVGVCD